MSMRTRRVRPSLGEVDYDDPDQWMTVIKAREAGGFLVYLMAGGLVEAPDGYGWVTRTEKGAERLARRVLARKRRVLSRKRARRAHLDIVPTDDAAGSREAGAHTHVRRHFRRAA